MVQHRISRIRFRHPPHKVVGIVPLPTSLLTRAMESIRLCHRRPHRHYGILLHQHLHRKDHAMYPSLQDLGPFSAWNMHQRIGLAQYERFLQHNHRFYHSRLAYTFGFETAAYSHEEDLGCFGFYFWSLVCFTSRERKKMAHLAILVHQYSAPSD